MTRSANEDERKNAKEDWERFFYVMCAFIRTKVDLYGSKNKNYEANNIVNTYDIFFFRLLNADNS